MDFDFRKLRFYYDFEVGAFRKLKYPTKLTFGQYRASSGYGRWVQRRWVGVWWVATMGCN